MYNIEFDQANYTADFIKQQYPENYNPKILIILGSGLSQFTHGINILHEIKYQDIEEFPQSSIMGHDNKLIMGKTHNGIDLLIMSGRFHYYEGYTAQQIAYPMVVFSILKIEILLVSNAAGGVNPTFDIGDIMLISDHINFCGDNPLIGKNNSNLGDRFLDLTNPYNQQLIDIAYNASQKLNIPLRSGTYMGVTGPNYETKAEVKAFAILGASSVGMSTIFEVIVANYFNIKVLGFSTITNMATGISNTPHSHIDVIHISNSISKKFSYLIHEILNQIVNLKLIS